MKILRNIIIAWALAAVALATSACPEKGPAEKAGEKIDDAVDETKDAVKDATKYSREPPSEAVAFFFGHEHQDLSHPQSSHAR